MEKKYPVDDRRYDGLDEDQADIMQMIDEYDDSGDEQTNKDKPVNGEKVDLPY